jgi:predicted dehydrogenase
MNLTPEQQELGRRNFLRVLAGTPAVAALAASAYVKGPVRGGPVRVGFVGLGGQGRVLLEQADPAYAEVRALCDVNPAQLARAEAVLAKKKLPPAPRYAEWKEMLQKEDLEAVIVAAPLWMHAEIVAGALEAGKHVLCEKMMAWDVAGCERMKAAADKAGKLLEIGYQRAYNPVYQAAYDGIVRSGVLGDMYHARLVWHRNQSWRRNVEEPAPGYDPSRWGYPTLDHLINWRLYWRYSKGLFAELASHQVNIANWFFGATPEAVMSSGGVLRFKDREVYDHVYATFEYPQGRTAIFSSTRCTWGRRGR